MDFEQQLNTAFQQWAESNKAADVIKDKSRLTVFKGRNEIEVDFNQFKEEYVLKYISPDMNAYCLKFLKSIEQTMFSNLARFKVRDYSFKFTFRYYGHFVGKTVNYYLLTKVA